MRYILILMLLAGCVTEREVIVERAPKSTSVVVAVPARTPIVQEAAKYIMRSDADPAKIAQIRDKLGKVKTKKDETEVQTLIRQAPKSEMNSSPAKKSGLKPN